MEKGVFWVGYKSQTKGNILYETRAIWEADSAVLPVQLCDRVAIFGKMCLEYTFDLKFGIGPGEVKF
jgi:hypothetical protein